ncbi:hypothetical protein PseudUWO311_03475 [Pseudanabaena sp. UWO311]|uniref:hypothetical protein n=1 Tax=Pseudanabaena sp. UWO311 TaxID=2487337 RepID=UPI00115A0EFA|nr:hypothetical protein [Pseudanabaena sp. UWO311]TYQ28563.1 hypothetical protein PseudUWO311_03475 [Pseudanabaena sp. UWO311]
MKSFFSSRVLKFNSLMYVCALGVTTFSLPMTAVAEEACVKTSAGNVVCGTLVPKSSSSSNRTDSDVTIDSQSHWSVTWDLKSCTRIQKKVRCILSLSSNQDTFIRVYASTRIVDSEGTSYSASLVQFGSQKIAGGGHPYDNVGNSMAKGARYKTIFEFADVPASVSQINLLEAPDGANGSIKFRDIPIN